MKKCNQCKKEKDINCFYRNKSRPDGHEYTCIDCERIRWQKRTYGISDYEELLKKQNGRCAICGVAAGDSLRQILFVDHVHETGRVRGLLCNNCNSLLGYAKDNIDILENAIRYLTAHCGMA